MIPSISQVNILQRAELMIFCTRETQCHPEGKNQLINAYKSFLPSFPILQMYKLRLKTTKSFPVVTNKWQNQDQNWSLSFNESIKLLLLDYCKPPPVFHVILCNAADAVVIHMRGEIVKKHIHPFCVPRPLSDSPSLDTYLPFCLLLSSHPMNSKKQYDTCHLWSSMNFHQ